MNFTEHLLILSTNLVRPFFLSRKQNLLVLKESLHSVDLISSGGMTRFGDESCAANDDSRIFHKDTIRKPLIRLQNSHIAADRPESLNIASMLLPGLVDVNGLKFL